MYRLPDSKVMYVMIEFVRFFVKFQKGYKNSSLMPCAIAEVTGIQSKQIVVGNFQVENMDTK